MKRNDVVPTVPLEEFGPTCLTNADLEAWAGVCGVTVREDYLGRATVTLEDAYRLREIAKKAEAEAQREAEVRAAAYAAQIRRNEVHAQAMRDALRGTRSTPEDFARARRSAWRAVEEAEAELPREVRDRLGGVPAGVVQISPS
jgi:hypothetical protein